MIYILDIMFEILLFLAILPYIVLFMFLIKKCVLFMERILNIKLLQEAPAEFDNVLFSGPDSFVHDPEMTSNYFLLAGSSFIISFIIGFCSNYMLNSEFYNLLGFAMLFLALAYALVIAGLRGNIFSYYGLLSLMIFLSLKLIWNIMV